MQNTIANPDVPEKAVLAAYANMAMCNAEAVVRHINRVFFPASPQDDESSNLDNAKNCIKTIDSWSSDTMDDMKRDRLERQIEKYIPFFKTLFSLRGYGETIPSRKLCVVKAYIQLLSDLRNYHSHVYHCEVDLLIGYKGDKKTYSRILYERECRNIEYELNQLFDAAVRTVKERHSLEEADLQHLRRKKGKNANPDFKHDFFSRNGESLQFTPKGLLFFFCQFLEKKYAFLLLKGQTGFKDSRTVKTQATLNVYTVRCLRLPRVRLECEATETMLGMDIANELYKCPKELFELLSVQDRAQFRIPADDSDADGEQILRKRSGDRFPYFALRYLEFKGYLPGIFFHIDMGNYFFDKYEKKLIDDSVIADRRLSKRMLCFDTLSNATCRFAAEKGAGLYQAKYDGDDVYQDDTFPHYHINDNQIGISLTQWAPDPDGRDTRLKHPDAWLSLYELPLIVWLCRNKKAEAVMERISGHIGKCREFFAEAVKSSGSVEDISSLRERFGINREDVPSLLTHERKDYDALLQQALLDMTESTRRMLAAFRKERSYTFKPGKKAAPRFKSGHIADILARDMLLFQPSREESSGSDKITAPNFQALQHALAYYGRDREKLPAIFRNAGLIESASPHPFLYRCLVNGAVPKTADGFFTTYLEKKIGYLECLAREEKAADAYVFRQYAKKKSLSENEERTRLAGSLSGLPVNLPRGLFADLFDAPATEQPTAPSYVIQQQLSASGDSSQQFYSFSRIYPSLNRMGVHIQSDMSLSDIKRRVLQAALPKQGRGMRSPRSDSGPGADETFKKKLAGIFADFEKNEKTLRFRKTCDVVSFYMMKDLLGITDPAVKLSLTDASDTFLLKQTHTLSVSFIADKKRYTLKGDMKIKHYGNFRRMLSDTRLPSYCAYFPGGHSFTYARLEKEFERYDVLRSEIFDAVHRLERAVKGRYQEEVKTEQKNKDYMDFYFLLSLTMFTEKEQYVLRSIRKAFAHGKYVKAGLFSVGDTARLTETMGVWSKERIESAFKTLEKEAART